ncbi:hypothetical protein PVAND_014130 [Polypedilum vanderplanki]|uniref:GST N-terminal domain-containing protein n=1 Tax=Polypedilum vanderplanki TaxID=319348 RepID=A0A9J6CRE7_POLVA|nr:hypothetical protein PVAND_014130 [Polypedilum vanderplanki]
MNFKAVNRFQKVPCIVDGDFQLSESVAIFRYLIETRNGVAENWYPKELKTRALVDEFLEYQHNAVRLSLCYHGERILATKEISFADVLAACELEQPKMAVINTFEGRPKLTKWYERVKEVTNPYYDEAHVIVNKVIQKNKSKIEHSFNYDPEVEVSEINHDVLFREGNYNRNVTFTPRMLLLDLKEFFSDNRLTSRGFLKEFQNDEISQVNEVPVMTSVQNSNELSNTLENLYTQVERGKLAKIPRFIDAGLEKEGYKRIAGTITCFLKNNMMITNFVNFFSKY